MEKILKDLADAFNELFAVGDPDDEEDEDEEEEEDNDD
jgi:hypothetical protein